MNFSSSENTFYREDADELLATLMLRRRRRRRQRSQRGNSLPPTSDLFTFIAAPPLRTPPRRPRQCHKDARRGGDANIVQWWSSMCRFTLERQTPAVPVVHWLLRHVAAITPVTPVSHTGAASSPSAAGRAADLPSLLTTSRCAPAFSIRIISVIVRPRYIMELVQDKSIVTIEH